jgi:membrane-associated protease RseP (regulator of RpoE activity)
MLFAAYVLLTLLALWGIVALYCLSMAIVGRVAGIAVDECAIGVGLVLFRFSLGSIPVTCKLIPISGYTKFRNLNDGEPLLERHRNPRPDRKNAHIESSMGDNPWRYESAEELLESSAAKHGSFTAAPYLVRLGILLCGPLTSCLAGLTLIALPVWMESQSRLVRFGNGKLVEPSGVPDLRLEQASPTQRSQLTLAEQSAGHYLRRLLLFRPLEGWGGGVACLVTSAAVAVESPWGWATLVGILALSHAVINLLPIPILNGGHILLATYAALFGPLGDRAWTRVNIAGFVFVLVVYARVLWLDFTWIKELV